MAALYVRASVHTGPKGGTEYRGWTGEHTFRTISRYVAWPYLSPEDKARAKSMEAARRADKKRRADDATAWRHTMRGG